MNFFFTLFSFFIFLNAEAVTGFLNRGKAVVEIDGVTKTLTKSTSCQPKNWKWEQDEKENSCQCCIAKGALQKDGTFVANAANIRKCKDKCSADTLQNLRGILKLEEEASNEDLVKEIVKNVSLVESVDLTISDYIKEGLKKLYDAGQLQKFKPTCAKVFPLGGGGYQTLQFFSVTDCKGKPVYIVKELKKKISEVKNIALIKNSRLKSLIYSAHNPLTLSEMPFIAVPELFTEYKDIHNKPHTLAVLDAAPGQQLIKILQEFAKNYAAYSSTVPSDEVAKRRIKYIEERKTLPRIMYDFGHQLGKFHVNHMLKKDGKLTGYSEAVHGDMHSNNIFIDPKNHNAVTFIDLETMASALEKPRYVGADLRKFYVFAATNKRAHQYAKGEIPAAEWHNIVIKPFLEGYIAAYAIRENGYVNEQGLKDVLKILKNSLLSIFGTKEKILDVLLVPTVYGKNPTKVLEYQSKHLRPIIEQLKVNFTTLEKNKRVYVSPYTPEKGMSFNPV